MMTGMTITEIAETVRAHIQPVLIGAGAVGTLIGLWTIWRWWTRGEAHTRMGSLAVAIATLLAGEGMWEVATRRLELAPWIAASVFGLFEVFVLSQGLMARHKLAGAASLEAGELDDATTRTVRQLRAQATRHIRLAWLGAAVSGAIAASAGDNLAEVLLRLIAPSVAVAIVWMELTSATVPEVEQEPTTWIWTPRRIGVELGLIRPGAEDLKVVNRDRQVRRMVRAAAAAEAGGRRARRAARRLYRLALRADDSMVREAAAQLQRAAGIREALKRPVVDNAPTEAEREVLDEVRLITRQAAERIRVDHIRAFGEGRRLVHGVVMPAAIADRIPDQIPPDWVDRHRTGRRTNGVDHTVDQPVVQERTNGADHSTDQMVNQVVDQVTGPDQDRSVDQPTAADQPSTSASVPGTRTTDRVDRARPASPNNGDIPPRVQAMARDLRRRYRGRPIPGRRVVMQAMGWTSAGDTQAAINLVRAERTRTDQTDPDPDRAAV